MQILSISDLGHAPVRGRAKSMFNEALPTPPLSKYTSLSTGQLAAIEPGAGVRSNFCGHMPPRCVIDGNREPAGQ